jgi:asparagine synthase (glutamine-hydrolysing)
MCSIFGYISTSQTIHQLHLQKLADLMQHRGEDDQGSFASEHIFLAHHRLAIQDLAVTGAQPMLSDNQRYVLLYNGEIYNHFSLRAKIDYSFKGNSDTETLLQLLIHFGVGILPELNGIFSLAFLDTETGNLIIARDELGVKPLYYHLNEQYFTFASEIKSITEHPGFDTSLHVNSLRNHLIYTYNPSLDTVYNQVHVFPAGTYVLLNIHEPICQLLPQKFSFSRQQYVASDESVLLKQLEQLLLESVERQMQADVPLGIMLSGGLDSSALLAIATTIKKDIQLPCYSVATSSLSTEGFDQDIDFARYVATLFGQSLYEVSGHVELEDLKLINNFLEEPCADIAAIYTYRIAKLAQSHGVKVLFSGAGADELWAGYRRHLLAPYQSVIQCIPDFIAHFASKNLDKPFFRRLNKVVGNTASTKYHRQMGYFKWHHENIIDSLFNEQFDIDPLSYFKNELVGKDLLDDVLAIELDTYLSRHNLLYHDKMGMANGVEIRVPLLDLELLHFAKQVPTSFKVKGFTTKYLFRKVMEKYLPSKIINRSKTGFGAPVRSLVTGQWKNEIPLKLADLPGNIFNKLAVNKLVNDNQQNTVDASYAILGLLLMTNLKFTDQHVL